MIPKECKRLAEVDFPIAVVSRHSAREKSIRHGHPSTLHLWWARRPLAACRAMLMALLLPDPCDEHCPEDFKVRARRALLALPARPGRWDSEVRSDEGLRKVLLEFIGDFANWDNAANAGYLACGRGLVKAAHPDETPLVVDPFAGGGSIPLEALRLGCDAFASDLNPVACLILKVLLEDIPRHGPELAEELRRVGAEIKAAAEKELGEFYPPDPDGARPIAYLWARTVHCEAPNCGAEIPLARSFWLCKKASRKRALRYEVARPQRGAPHVEFEIFEPRRESEVPSGTVSRAKATCPCCGIVLPPERVRAQLSEQRGGADVIFDQKGRRAGGARMLAVVTLRPGDPGRHYRLSTERDYSAVSNAQQRLTRILNDWERNGRHGLCPAPNEPLPPRNTNSFRLPNYGVRTWSELFNNRQRAALVTCCGAVRAHTLNRNAGLSEALADAIALVASRCADASSAHSAWRTGVECNRSTFARQALSMVWDFCESVTTTDAAGGYDGALGWVAEVIEAQGRVVQTVGQVAVTDATEPRLPDATGAVWFTDPPYYDAVGYAELSDYFYVWLRRCGENSRLRDPFDPENPLVPKTRECVQDERYRDVSGVPKDRKFFERTMASAFSAGRRVARADGVGCVVFAHKTTEGWEALLSGMIRGGWTITGSWPIATERPGRLRSQESAALATSIHLICRPRPDDAPVGDWGDVLRELPRRVEAWMDRLQDEGVRGADLVFACIGPALEIFSRYSKVETAEGREVPLDEYLLKVWEVVGRTALNQVLGTAEPSPQPSPSGRGRVMNGAAGALEEDARLTALFLWTLQATTEESPTNGKQSRDREGAVSPRPDPLPEGEGDEDEDDTGEDAGATQKGKKKAGFSLIFDVARRFAQPLGIHLEAWEKRILETEKGVVRLIPVLERAGQLFGEEGAASVADRLERSPATAAAAQMMLFPEPAAPPKVRGRGRRKKGSVADSELETRQEATTLDRVHAAMLLQASGRANALRALLKAEVERGPDFLRLANALSALYPQGSDEKRLLDAMLLAVPR